MDTTNSEQPDRWRLLAIVMATCCWFLGVLLVATGLFMTAVTIYYNVQRGPIHWSPDQDTLNQFALTPSNIVRLVSQPIVGVAAILAALGFQRRQWLRATCLCAAVYVAQVVILGVIGPAV